MNVSLSALFRLVQPTNITWCSMDTRNPPDHLYQLMLFTRAQLAEDVKKLSPNEQLFVKQHIAELDGYLTLHAPTNTAH